MGTTIIHGNDNTTKLCNFLKSQAKQYPSLSKEEERAMIKKYKNDRNKLNELLFMHNIKLVFNIAKKYVSKTRDFDALVQDGMNGLSEAVKRFDISKNIKFTTFGFFWIRKYILANFDQKRTHVERHSISLNSPTMYEQNDDSNQNGSSMENYIQTEIDPTVFHTKSIHHEISSNEQVSICKNLMQNLENDSSLSATDRAIFVDYFYNKEKIRDIADKYGVTCAFVSQLKTQILGKLKNVLVNDYNINSYSDVM